MGTRKLSQMSLLYLASKKVYYYCVNAIKNFIKGGFWYCTCDKFQGCVKQNRCSSYCYICKITETYCKQGKDKPILKLIKFATAFFEDLKLCYDFDNSVNYFWWHDY